MGLSDGAVKLGLVACDVLHPTVHEVGDHRSADRVPRQKHASLRARMRQLLLDPLNAFKFLGFEMKDPLEMGCSLARLFLFDHAPQGCNVFVELQDILLPRELVSFLVQAGYLLFSYVPGGLVN